jgi:hypothetical protein
MSAVGKALLELVVLGVFTKTARVEFKCMPAFSTFTVTGNMIKSRRLKRQII